MDKSTIDQFVAANSSNFKEEDLQSIITRLENVPDHRTDEIMSTSFKSPVLALVLSIFLGEFAVDRFYLGKTGTAIAKLLTCGGFGIWYIIDLFLAMGNAKECNAEKMEELLK